MKLKEGDKVACKLRFSKNYTLSEVVRVTKTLAILSNGDKIQNKDCEDGFFFSLPGYKIWELLQEKHIKVNELYQQEKKVIDWFRDKQFTIEEKTQIHKMFN